MNTKKLQIDQLEGKVRAYASAKGITSPPVGWVKAIRTALGISLQQLANKLSVSKNSIMHTERREADGSITINTLRQVANALDMDLVYGFVPKDGTLDALIERKAKELAVKIVSRTSNTMKLEDQENSEERLKKAIAERTAVLKNEMPKMLWD